MTAGSRILKAVAPLPERRVPACVHETDRRVREMLSAAGTEAGRIRAEAEAARDRVRARAEEEGRQEGLARAAAQLAAAGADRDRLLAGAEREVVALALDVARKVLGRELAGDPDLIAELAARALAEARERREVVLRVNPADAAALRAGEERLAALLVRAHLLVREDASLAPGAVLVETEAGRVDGGVEAQLAYLARALEEALCG